MKFPVLVLNFKAYKKASDKFALRLAKVCDEVARKFKISIVVCPQFHDIKEISKKFKNIAIFSQHIDPIDSAGAFTGHVVAENIKDFVKGTLINHSERRLRINEIKKCIKVAKKYKLISLCCASSPSEVKKIAKFNPDIIAIEPPELIGTGISVSKAKPEIITKSVNLVKNINKRIKVLCGAGISSHEDVKKTLELGAEGVLIASAFVKSKNPRVFLEKIAKVIKHFG